MENTFKRDILWFLVIATIVVGGLWIFLDVQSKSDMVNLPETSFYSNKDMGFVVTVPPGFFVDEKYVYGALGPGKEINEVTFRIPEDYATSTNLSKDSYVGISRLDNVSCMPGDFLFSPSEADLLIRGDNTFMVATSGGAGAGNLYEETIHIIKKENKCYGIRYFIHSTNIGNYEPGTVKEFDKQKLFSSFDTILSSFVIE